MPSSSPSRLAAGLLVAALALGACSSDGENARPGTAPGDGGAPATSDTSAVLASAVGDFPGGRVEVYGLKRTGDALRLDFGVVNTGREPVPLAYSMRDPGFENDVFRDASGLVLIDPENAKAYRVHLGPDDRSCRCSSDLGYVEPGRSARLFAEFPLPPREVRSLHVWVPHYTPMLDVPLDGSTARSEPDSALPRPVATTSGTGDARGLSLELQDVVRTGRLSILRFALRNTGSEPFNPGDRFQAPELRTPRVHNLSGVTLRDPVARKQYLALRDASGYWLCSRDIGFDGPLEPGASEVFWVGFPAPQPDVASVDVAVPGFPPVSVPVTGAPG